MNITIATGPYLPVPALQGGSTNRIWQQLAEKLVTRGHTVTIVARSYATQPKTEIINGVSYLRLYGFDQSGNILVDLVKDLYDAFKVSLSLPQSDIIVINDFWLPIITALKKRRVGKVVSYIGRYPKHQMWLQQKTDLIIAASDIITTAIKRQAPSLRDRVIKIPYPVDTSKFKPCASSTPSVDSNLLYVGRIHREKGLELLLGAAEHGDIQVNLVGPFEESQGGSGQAYKAELLRKFPRTRTNFIGPVFEIEKLTKYYQQASVFVYPSVAEKGETFGVAPLEAMACGCPVIVSKLECFNEHVIDGSTGLVFDHRSKNPCAELRGCIDKLLTDVRFSEKLKENAMALVEQFSVQGIAEKYEAAFNDLLLG